LSSKTMKIEKMSRKQLMELAKREIKEWTKFLSDLKERYDQVGDPFFLEDDELVDIVKKYNSNKKRR
jgi:hypothetical protein